MITYFGYGSLVNRNTRPANEQALPARLHGWRRAWAHRVAATDNDGGACSSLTVEPLEADDAPGGIDGVVVQLPRADLPALDARELGYARLMLPASNFSVPAECTAETIAVYVSLPENTVIVSQKFPVLQSYVDCVMAGYANLFDDSGLREFIHSTRGWHGPIENDRQQPRYPRAVSLAAKQLDYHDRLLSNYRLHGHLDYCDFLGK